MVLILKHNIIVFTKGCLWQDLTKKNCINSKRIKKIDLVIKLQVIDVHSYNFEICIWKSLQLLWIPILTYSCF